jgi:hypothetical protein
VARNIYCLQLIGIRGMNADRTLVKDGIARLGLGASDSQADRLSPAARGMIDVQRRLLEMALAPNDPEDGWQTAKRAARQTKVERVTASRDLARMEELGVIEKDPAAGGRSTRYRVRLSERSPPRDPRGGCNARIARTHVQRRSKTSTNSQLH